MYWRETEKARWLDENFFPGTVIQLETEITRRSRSGAVAGLRPWLELRLSTSCLQLHVDQCRRRRELEPCRGQHGTVEEVGVRAANCVSPGHLDAASNQPSPPADLILTFVGQRARRGWSLALTTGRRLIGPVGDQPSTSSTAADRRRRAVGTQARLGVKLSKPRCCCVPSISFIRPYCGISICHIM